MYRYRVKNILYFGFSTIEIILALALFSLVCGAIIQVSASNQNLVIDTALTQSALASAQGLLEEVIAVSAKDFSLVNTTLSTVSGQFQNHIEVKTLPDFESKLVTAKVLWRVFGLYDQELSLSTLITRRNVGDTDTCDSNISGDWSSPKVLASIDLGNSIGDASGTYPITDIDAYFGILYVTTNNTASNKATLHIFNSSNPRNVSHIASIDNDSANNTGLNAVTLGKIAGDPYIFVASASSFVKGQLQIISTSPPYAVVTYKIPTTIVRGSSTQGIGNTIFYSNGYVYLGLKKTISGPEFNIIDVRDPDNPIWAGGYNVGNGVNSILIKNGYAYIASPNNQELMTLYVSNPSNPYYVGGYDAPDNVGNGKSLSAVGDTLYFGRTVTSLNPEFVVLNNSNPNAILPPALGTKEIGSSVNGLFIRDYLAFLLTNSQLQIVDISDPKNTPQFSQPVALMHGGGSPAPSLECEGNYVYIGSNDASNRGYITVVSSQ